MRKGWEIKRLEDVCDKASSNIALNKIENDNGDYPIYGASGFLKNVSFYHQEKPYIGIIKDGAGVGRISLLEAYSSVIGTLQYLIPNPDIDIKYFYYFLLGIDFSKYINGSTIPHIYFKDYKGEPFLYLPISEQQYIVSILDEAFAAIDQAKENLQRNLQNAKELFQSELNNIFLTEGNSWEKKKLNQVSQNLDNKRIPITKNVRSSGEYPYYGASGIVDYVGEYIFDDDLLLVSEDGANLLARTYPIAFSIRGKTWVNNHAHVLKFENMVSQKFVEYYLNSIKLDDFVSGMAQPKLNQTMLNTIPIPFPAIKVQKKTLNRIDILFTQTKNLEKIYQQKLDNLEELKKSILQKAFSGELTIKRTALA